MEHLLKFGAPQCVQEIRDEAFKIRQLVEFSYMEDGTERGQGGNFHLVRDKARLINMLVSDFQQLEAEREAARQLSSRYVGISSDEFYSGGGRASYSSSMSSYQPAADTSQRTNFGSGQTSSQWTANTRGFEPPSLPQPSGVQSTYYEQPKQTHQLNTGIFEPPKTQAEEINIFDPKPKVTQPVSQYQQPVQPGSQYKPTFGEQSKAQTAPTDIFALPVKPKTDLFTVPSSGKSNTGNDIFAMPKVEVAPQKEPIRSQPPTQPIVTSPAPVPEVITRPGTVTQNTGNGSNPGVGSVLDGLFSGQPSSQTPVMAKQGAGGSYGKPGMQAAIKIHHNMEQTSLPTLSELKATPSLAQSTSSPPPPKRKSGDLESFLVDLDNLKVEAARDKRETTHLGEFGVGSGSKRL